LPENADISIALGGAAIGVAFAIAPKPKSNDAPIANPRILEPVIGNVLLILWPLWPTVSIGGTNAFYKSLLRQFSRFYASL